MVGRRAARGLHAARDGRGAVGFAGGAEGRLAVDHRGEAAQQRVEPVDSGLEDAQCRDDRLERRDVVGARLTAQPVAARLGRRQANLRQLVQPGLRRVHLSRVRPGAVEDDEMARVLVSRQRRQVARAGSGVEHRRARRQRRARVHARRAGADADVAQPEAREAHRADRVQALARVLQDQDAGAVRDARDRRADAGRGGLEAAVALGAVAWFVGGFRRARARSRRR